jgi:cell division protease FtsH
VLRANWHSVVETARALIEQETLSGVALDALLSPVSDVSIEELTEIHGEDHLTSQE